MNIVNDQLMEPLLLISQIESKFEPKCEPNHRANARFPEVGLLPCAVVAFGIEFTACILIIEDLSIESLQLPLVSHWASKTAARGYRSRRADFISVSSCRR